jgi:glucoamylase
MKLIMNSILSLLFLQVCPVTAAEYSLKNVKMWPANIWLQKESQIAETLLLKNISPEGTKPGSVIASPQKENPNYYRHWVRDSALTMQVVLKFWSENKIRSKANFYNHLLQDYAQFSRKGQRTAGLGEPIFEVDGTPFLGPWGRPQNDGPAYRAIVLAEWAERLIDAGETDYVKNNLYSASLPAQSVIKADLEYVSSHWMEPCFDLWEEVKAQHFYTKMIQRKALLVGANLARRMSDPLAAEWYELQARKIENSILEFAHLNSEYIGASSGWVEGLHSKNSNLDISVILGVLHGSYDSFFKASDSQVQKTFEKINAVFANLYPINQNLQNGAAGLGRYPEDIYAGAHFNGGNPWVLATLAGAEYCYKVASETAAFNVKTSEQWMKRGDSFIQRVQFHANPDGSLSEQIDKYSGYMTSARDLTWNYAAVLTTSEARRESEIKIALAKNKIKTQKTYKGIK